MFRTIALRLAFCKNRLKYRHVKFKGRCVLFAFRGSSIEIGDNTTVLSRFESNLAGLYQRCIIVARYGGRIEIGQNCGISGSTIYSYDKISIGDYTRIGANCKIIDNDFHPIELQYRHDGQNEHYTRRAPITIGKDCFIGMNSIILKGTKLGNNVIVGAGSVVHGCFPDNCIIAGNPARIVKMNEK